MSDTLGRWIGRHWWRAIGIAVAATAAWVGLTAAVRGKMDRSEYQLDRVEMQATLREINARLSRQDSLLTGIARRQSQIFCGSHPAPGCQ